MMENRVSSQLASESRPQVVLIPGLLRCIDENFNELIRTTPPETILIIVTQREYEREAHALCRIRGGHVFYEEDEVEGYESVNLVKLVGPNRQAIKLQIALDKLYGLACSSDLSASVVHKIRTDIKYTGTFGDVFCSGLERLRPATIFNRHDFSFTCLFATACMMHDVARFFSDYLSSKEFFGYQLLNVNKAALLESCPNSAPYARSFPVGIVNEDVDPDSFYSEIKKTYANCADAAIAFSRKMADSDAQARSRYVDLAWHDKPSVRAWIDVFYPKWCENIWARYLNYKGLTTYSYSTPFRLKASRFATTQLLGDILNMCDEGNLLFLDQNIDWQACVREALERSVHHDLNAKIAVVLIGTAVAHHTELTHPRMESLLSAIEALDCQWTPVYSSEFKELMNRYGHQISRLPGFK